MFGCLVDIPFNICEKYPERVSHRFRKDKGIVDKTYRDFIGDIKALASGFKEFGIKEKDHVSFFVNNRYEWSLTDFSLQTLRAVSVPRGSDTAPLEAEFIFNHSDSTYIIFENISQMNECQNICRTAVRIFIIDSADYKGEFSDKVVFYDELLKKGREVSVNNPDLFFELKDKIESDDIVSIIYTSGTTGNPKGVVLTQKEFVENVKMTAPRMGIDEKHGEVTVTVLPAWHAFERTFEYAGMSCGLSFVYSSLKFFGSDILREKPHVLASVPRIWDSIYGKMNQFMKSQGRLKRAIFFKLVKINYKYKKSFSYLRRSCILFDRESFPRRYLRINICLFRIIFYFGLHLLAERVFKSVRDKVGGRLRCAISGGGSLPVAVDRFFFSVGIDILNAYGMTECSPGISSRTVERNTLGSVGTPFDNTMIKIMDDELQEISDSSKGTLYVKGPQIMNGYYKNREATDEILSPDGWLNTGDLARRTIFGDVVLVGRSKDTIVLLGGENVDPLAIEDKIQESEMVDHVMLLGQDKKGLTAFIALNEEALSNFANEVKVKIADIFSFHGNDREQPSEEYKILEKKIKKELDEKISKESGFKPFEKITKVILVKNNFKIGRELTQTLKIKRKQIEEIYHKIISRFMDDEEK